MSLERPGWFLYIGGSAQVRIWSGPFAFKMGANGPDAEGGTYLGLGLLVGVPELTLPINGAASQHVLSLSGVNAETVRLLNADRDSLRGAPASIGRIDFAADYSMAVDDMTWLWSGIVSTPRIERNGSNSPVTYTIGIIATSGAPSRKFQQLTFYTGPQQRERDANDAACDGTAQLAQGTMPIWPA